MKLMLEIDVYGAMHHDVLHEGHPGKCVANVLRRLCATVEPMTLEELEDLHEDLRDLSGKRRIGSVVVDT